MQLSDHVVRAFSVCYIATLLQLCNSAEKTVSYSCHADVTNGNLVKLTIRFIPHQDPIYKVYGFNAASGDTSLSANRINACVKDTTGISNVDTDAIVFDLSYDITGSSFDCGATVYIIMSRSMRKPEQCVRDQHEYRSACKYVQSNQDPCCSLIPQTDLTGVSGVKKVTMILRVFAYSETLLSGDDDVYKFECRSDDLNAGFVTAGALDQSTVVVPSVTVLPLKYGAYLRIRDAATDVPLTVGALSQSVYMSVEFYPQLSQGPDAYGTTFYIGFLGNDVISGSSVSSLFIVVIPRYKGRTDVMVVTSSGMQQQNVSDGSPMTFNIPTDVQGCSDGGTAEIEYKGVKVHSYDKEVAVLVYNREADTEDVYTALPADVLGDRYYTVSMPSNNAVDVSEFMIVGTVNGTSVSVTIPTTTTSSVTLNGTTKSAGQVLSFTLNERQAFHLGVSSSTATESLTGYLVVGDNPLAVFSGNRRFSNDHLVDQLTPTAQLGDYYILTPADPQSDNRLTTYIVQAVESGDTKITRYLTSSTNENYTITLTTNPVKIITVAHNEPCEIFSDKPVMVTQIVNTPTGSNTDFETAMLVMPPVYRFSHQYTLHHADYFSKVALILPSADASITIDGGPPLSLSNKMAVIGPNGYQFTDQGVTLPGGTVFTLASSSSTNKLHQFLPIIYSTKGSSPKNSGSVYIPPGLSNAAKDYCYAVGHPDDHVDNDCDKRIDEELADGLDNDGDGLFDEDTIASLSALTGFLAIRPFSCLVSGVADFSDSTKQVSLTKADGCKETRTGPFALSEDFTNVVTSDVGTGTQPKQLKTGNFTLAKFVDSPKLYFKCDTTTCTSATDNNCRVICPPVVRRKREEAETKPEPITSDIWINPYLPGRAPKSNTGDSPPAQDVVSTQTCLENSKIQLILSMLLVMFVMAFSTAICFCCLFRRRWSGDKRRRQPTTYTTHRGPSSASYSKRDFPTRFRY